MPATDSELEQETASPHWYRLPETLEDLMDVVPREGLSLERTTLLTLMYFNRGLMAFDGLAERMPDEQSLTARKKMVRRALRGLLRIGAIDLSNQSADNGASFDAEDDADEGGGEARVGRWTVAQITKDGMTWLRRAWHARYLSYQNSTLDIKRIHAEILKEEEEGKGTEAHWIERINDKKAIDMAPRGEVSKWIGPAVTSVFDLSHVVLSKIKKTKKAGEKNGRGREDRGSRRR